LRIFKTKDFNKWAKKAGLGDKSLSSAVSEIESGLVDANLGGNLYKKRVAAAGRGKSGSCRTLLAYKKGKTVFFVYGFEKNERDNINAKEEKALKDLAKLYFGLSTATIKKAVNIGELIEVKHG
jgi:hypothetical protein